MNELNKITIHITMMIIRKKGIGRELVQVVIERLGQMKIQSMLVWVLEENPASHFYKKLGGKYVTQKEIERNGKQIIKIAYGWTNNLDLQHSSAF